MAFNKLPTYFFPPQLHVLYIKVINISKKVKGKVKNELLVFCHISSVHTPITEKIRTQKQPLIRRLNITVEEKKCLTCY